jgi:hypothetical protein
VDTPDGRSHYGICIGVAQLNPLSPDRIIAGRPRSAWPKSAAHLADGRSAAAHEPKPHGSAGKRRTAKQVAQLAATRPHQPAAAKKTRTPYKTFPPNAGRKAKQAVHD